MDAVICCHPMDFETLPMCVRGVCNNIDNINTIYIISKEDPFIEGTTWVSESQFPFGYSDIAPYTTPDRVGWYLQQLLKLYAFFVIPISVGVIIDADTIFLNPTSFKKEGKWCYAHGTEYHVPYFQHMNRLHTSFSRFVNVSGICHHMVMERVRLEEIFSLVESTHQKPFWRVFMDLTITPTNNLAVPSGASEYELYFHYIFQFHKDEYVLRPLNWKNSGHPEYMEKDKTEGWNYVSYHAYMRQVS